jgi:glucose-1-phosphate thymidylyltransferase
MHAFILAGGFATRLWPLTEQRAKPLLPLAGKPIITHLVEKIPQDIPVTVSTNAAFREGFTTWLTTIDRKNVHVLVEETRNDDEKLGALGAVAQWIEKEKIQDDVLLLTGDNYCGFSLQQFLAAAIPGTALLAAHDIGDRDAARAFGTVLLKGDGRTVAGFEEKPKDPKTTLVSTGCSLLPASTLSILVAFAKEHPDNVGGIFEELLRKGETVHCFQFNEPWFDIGSFQAYLAATKALVGNAIHTESGVNLEGTECNGSVVLGKQSTVHNSRLENVVLFEHCSIDDCVLTDCVLDDNCTLKGVDLTGKMLRAGTELIQRS